MADPRGRPPLPGRWRWSPDAGLSLGADADLARRADQALGTPAFAMLADRCGVGGQELARRALAWRYGGPSGLELLHGECDPAEAAEAAELLKAAGGAA